MTADPLAVAVRFGLYLVLGLLFGRSVFALHGGDRTSDDTGGVFLGAVAGTLLSGGGIAVLAASMAGVPIWTVDPELLTAVVAMPGTGAAFKVRLVALAALVAAALALSGRRLRRATALLGGIALGSLAWNGHAAATEGGLGLFHLVADVAHLLGAGAWLGALVGLLSMLRPGSTATAGELHAALVGFGRPGTVIVAVLLLTGAINMFAVVGVDKLPALALTAYGQLLLLKLALFALMLLLAARHRFRMARMLEDSLDRPAEIRAAIRRSIAVEAAALVLVLAVVAALGLLAP